MGVKPAAVKGPGRERLVFCELYFPSVIRNCVPKFESPVIVPFISTLSAVPVELVVPAMTYCPALKFTAVLVLPLMFMPPQNVKVWNVPVVAGADGVPGHPVLSGSKVTTLLFPIVTGAPVAVPKALTA